MSGFEEGLTFTKIKRDAEIILVGSKPVRIEDFPSLKGIFRAGVGRDNVPIKEAKARNILIRFPSEHTRNIIFDETAAFTCSLIFKMMYKNVGTIDPWYKNPRRQLKEKILLIVGTGKIGKRVAKNMKSFLKIIEFDILHQSINKLIDYLKIADCVTIHIPASNENKNFFSKDKLSLIKQDAVLINTARGSVVNEDALYEMISRGKIKAAFDVYWNEPYNGKLKDFHPDTFFMTPHIASTCREFIIGCRNDLDTFIKDIQVKSN